MSGMNFLEKLLDGVAVELKPLGEVSRLITKGTTPKKFIASGINFIKTENFENSRINPQKFMFVSQETHEKELKRSILEANDILFAIAGSIGKCTVVEDSILPANTNQALAIIRLDETVNVRFIFYCMQTLAMQEYIAKYNKASAQPNLNLQQIGNFPIPIPCPENLEKSLAIQAEIVRILDTFTALTAELTAELIDRKKQYEYYRDRLLTFEKGEVECKTLGDIAEINTGQKPTEIFDNATDYDYINAGTTRSGYSASSNCEGNTVTTPSRGQGGIGYVGYQKTPFWLGPLCYKLRSTDKALLINKYLFYFLQSESDLLLGLKKEGGVPAVNKSDLAKLEIPVPPLEEQKRIVAILDKFDTLTHSISEGLPREIALRQKQYEYYRDLLLTFPKPEEVKV